MSTVKNLQKVVAALAVASLVLPLTAEPATAASKSTVRDRMSADQKKQIRKRAFDWCKKKFGNVNRVEIKSDGRVFCYYVQ